MSRTSQALLLCIAPALATACSFGGDFAASPTWLDDVRPIVQANCLRCHAPPFLGGASTDFRLDVYGDTTLADGRTLRGAFAMARFIAIRAGEQETMPPEVTLSQGQRDTLIRWWQEGAPLGDRPRNRAPKAELLSGDGAADQEPVSLVYEVRDPNGDLVSGRLRVGDRVVSELVLSGRGSALVHPASLAEGDYPIVAFLSDDQSPVQLPLGTLRVRHASGNTAPSVILENSLQDALIADLQSPYALSMTISDPDLGDTLQLEITAFRGQEQVVIASSATVAAGTLSYPLDTSTIPEGGGWRLRLRASDGLASSLATSGSFVVSHQSTTKTYQEVGPLFHAACFACHRGANVQDLLSPNFVASEDPKSQVATLRGKIYRRLILEGNMPPLSAPVVAGQEGLPWRPLTADEKAAIAEYLLGGTP